MKVQVVDCEDDFWSVVRKFPADYNDWDEDEEGQIDLDLQEAIGEVLVPLLGHWYEGTWFHNDDHYGDGVRAIAIGIADFPWHTIEPLQALLVGDATDFSITIQFFDQFPTYNGLSLGFLGILCDRLVVTPAILELLQVHHRVEL